MENADFTVTSVRFSYIRKYAPPYVLQMKQRPNHGLTLVLSGSLEMLLDGHAYIARAGDMLLQRANDSYRLSAGENGTEYVVISYSVKDDATLLPLLPDRLFTPEHFGRLQSAFLTTARLYEEGGVCHKPLLCALVQEILCGIIRENAPLFFHGEQSPVYYAKKYMDEYYHRPLSAENVAAVVGLSPSHLRALFREAGEESPIRYLNRVRIEHAKEMIASGMFHLDEIAAACGFSSVYYFSRVFKSYVGVPPGKY